MATPQVEVAEKRVRPEKLALVERYAEILKNAKSVYLADYIGLNVAQAQELRKQCREGDILYRVVKNRLLRRAADAAGFEALGAHLTGPIAIAVSNTDEVSPAKLLTKFAKEHQRPKLKGAVVDGVIYDAAEADVLAKLPGLNDLRSMILQVINAPATQLVRVVNAPGTQLVRVLDARREQLETSG